MAEKHLGSCVAGTTTLLKLLGGEITNIVLIKKLKQKAPLSKSGTHLISGNAGIQCQGFLILSI